MAPIVHIFGHQSLVHDFVAVLLQIILFTKSSDQSEAVKHFSEMTANFLACLRVEANCLRLSLHCLVLDIVQPNQVNDDSKDHPRGVVDSNTDLQNNFCA